MTTAASRRSVLGLLAAAPLAASAVTAAPARAADLPRVPGQLRPGGASDRPAKPPSSRSTRTWTG
ncbi:hypothetical protein [Prauserella endophytica]|uniref:Uncharacterized protein n=1 Tax=Prauserella endophytica TaxID=1592324 RepID=A0ABY2RYI0_9PSEU|nr:hypothetical protein [Prauserella endophytica]TKG65244.1 hypothetical protein FCN18_27445 [Prauserella endophytica]